jgi:hypothetical protein
MDSGPYETSYEKLGIALQAEDAKLHGVHQGVEQRTFRERFVEDDYVKKRERVHVSDCGQIVEPESASLSVERRSRDALALEFHEAYVVKQNRRKIGPHAGLMMVRERLGCGEIALALFAKVRGDALDGVRDLLGGQLRFGMARVLRIFFLNRLIKLVQGTGGFGGFAQEVATPEAGEIVRGIMQAQLMSGAMRGQKLQLSVLELRIHLRRGPAVGGTLMRTHLETHS